MNVLSLFDGISVARVALDYAGIQVKKYYSAEIDKYAVEVSKKNYPDIIRLGNVCDISGEVSPFELIDLLVGGSPCQDLSIAKKGRKGLDGNRSGLFWEYVRIRALVKPKWFILENVASMPEKDRDIITDAMGVQPVMFNASLVSAQTRKRYFWTNIKFDLPMDKGIILKDILQPDAEVDERLVNRDKKAYTLTASYSKVSASEAQIKHNIEKKQRTMVNTKVEQDKNLIIHETAQTGRNETKKLGYVGEKDHQAKRFYDSKGKLPALNAICNSMVKVGTMGKNYSQGNKVYSPEGKSACLSARSGGLGANTGLYKVGRVVGRRLNADGKREDDNLDLEFTQQLEIRDDDKSNNLSTVQKDNVVVSVKEDEQQFIIRKLTPIECERLQSLPDKYTQGVSNTQRYKCLGNAFNAEVISYILKHI
jgi:DNA (cytosine-5)-methyltransferase 3A